MTGAFGRKQHGNNEAGEPEPQASSCGVDKIDKAGNGTLSRTEVEEASGKAGRNGLGNHKLCGQGGIQDKVEDEEA